MLVADEPTTALDVTIQAQVIDVLMAAKHETGAATILVTHDLGLVAEVADRVMVMYAGRIVEQATTAELFEAPAHPYTIGLIASLPSLRAPPALLDPRTATELGGGPERLPVPGALRSVPSAALRRGTPCAARRR